MIKRLEKVSSRRFLSILVFSAAIIAGAVILVKEGSKIPWQSFQLKFGLFFLSLVISGIGFFPAVSGWRGILRIFNLSHPFTEDLRNFVYSMLGFILPGGIWTIVGRSLLYKKQELSSLTVTTASILETIIVGIAGWIVYWIGAVFRPDINITDLKGLQYLFLVPSLVLLEPHILRKFIGWILKKSKQTGSISFTNFSYFDILRILILEVITLIIGGLAIFTLIQSVYPISPENFVPVVAAYGFSLAASKIFLGLPGTMVIKDTAMTVALSQILPLGISVLIVVIIRVWAILTVLLPAGLTWLLVDTVRFAFRRL